MSLRYPNKVRGGWYYVEARIVSVVTSGADGCAHIAYVPRKKLERLLRENPMPPPAAPKRRRARK